MNKWIGISLGAVVGISHIGMIGLLANRTSFPALPVSDYTSYTVESGKEGYRINYRACLVRRNINIKLCFYTWNTTTEN